MHALGLRQWTHTLLRPVCLSRGSVYLARDERKRRASGEIRSGYMTPAFSGSPVWGKSKVGAFGVGGLSVNSKGQYPWQLTVGQRPEGGGVCVLHLRTGGAPPPPCSSGV